MEAYFLKSNSKLKHLNGLQDLLENLRSKLLCDTFFSFLLGQWNVPSFIRAIFQLDDWSWQPDLWNQSKFKQTISIYI